MLHFLKLIRLPNLLVVALTQALIFYQLIKPAFQRNGIALQLSDLQLWLIAAACIAVTASGYIINDILDADGDAINRPGKNQVYVLGLGACRYAYLFFVLIGYGFSLFLAIMLGQEQLLWLYPLAVGLLALYTRYIKPLPLAGNLLVAIFCAGVPALIALAEREGLSLLWQSEPAMIRILIIYSLFAFLSTLLRELVKDMEDFHGDKILGRKTLPIIAGMEASRIIALLLAAINLFAILSPFLLKWPAFQHPPVIACLGLLAALLFLISIGLLRGKSAKDFHRISQSIKILMLFGLGMLVVI